MGVQFAYGITVAEGADSVLLHPLLPGASCSGWTAALAAALLAHAETARRVCSAAADSVKGLQRAAGGGQLGHEFSGARRLWATE
jgi:hypothetical protein